MFHLTWRSGVMLGSCILALLSGVPSFAMPMDIGKTEAGYAVGHKTSDISQDVVGIIVEKKQLVQPASALHSQEPASHAPSVQSPWTLHKAAVIRGWFLEKWLEQFA